MAKWCAITDAGGGGRVGVGLRWVAGFEAGGKARTTWGGALVNYQRNSNQLNIGPG
jgi:hypothetical protein